MAPLNFMVAWVIRPRKIKIECWSISDHTEQNESSEDTGTRVISLRMLPDKSPHARFSLRHVEIITGGTHPGRFRVERTDADDMVTSSGLADPDASPDQWSSR